MNKSLCPIVVVAALLGPVVALAQSPGVESLNAPIASAPVMQNAPRPGGPLPPPPGMTDYLAYLRPNGCCGPVGGSGPITCEVAFRPGVSFPIGSSIFGRVMDPGFMLQGGLRTLFFNTSQDTAFTVELGITTAWYDAHVDEVVYLRNVERVIRTAQGQPVRNDDGVPQNETFPLVPLIPSSLHELYVHLGIGQEYYVCGSADCGDDGPKLRCGYDGGGRWGTSKLIAPRQRFIGDGGNPNRDLPNHFTDVVGGMYFALHTDYEVPFKCAMFFAGVRTEFSYIWADLLQTQNNTDLMTINLLFNFGCRF